MRTTRTRRLRLGLTALSLTAVLTSCGLGTSGGYVPTAELSGELEDVQLDGVEVSVGSKNFTEQVLLGKMMVILLESGGAEAEDLTNIPGSSSARQALLEGIIDFQWEYTGTAWITYMGNTDPVPDVRGQWQAVRDADAENGLVWSEPAELDNTYAFTMTREKSEQLDVDSLDDLKDLPAKELSFCVDAEFLARSDGFRPMLDAYGIPEVPESRLKTMDAGAIYQAVDNGECTFGEAFATDGRIPALDLVVLEDPKPYFPKYNLSGVVNEQTLQEHPELRPVIAAVTQRLDNETMAELNKRVDVDGEEPADVAYDWLLSEGLIRQP